MWASAGDEVLIEKSPLDGEQISGTRRREICAKTQPDAEIVYRHQRRAMKAGKAVAVRGECLKRALFGGERQRQRVGKRQCTLLQQTLLAGVDDAAAQLCGQRGREQPLDINAQRIGRDGGDGRSLAVADAAVPGGGPQRLTLRAR